MVILAIYHYSPHVCTNQANDHVQHFVLVKLLHFICKLSILFCQCFHNVRGLFSSLLVLTTVFLVGLIRTTIFIQIFLVFDLQLFFFFLVVKRIQDACFLCTGLCPIELIKFFLLLEILASDPDPLLPAESISFFQRFFKLLYLLMT